MVDLLNFVENVKNALEDDEVKKSYVGFYDFPRGACMDASILLGILLGRQGFGDFDLVSASYDRERFFTHAWLENQNYLIDITVEQFSDWPKQSHIINLTSASERYNYFEIIFREPLIHHNNVPDLGFYAALSLVEEKIRTA
ncbi:hypothetical protein [Mucilaginibacter segetis]|uniref:Uncharacterized protein n=1 Tax=Mucilaginibacter segetis TaxID=2793071 RepID=A0A934UME8_9SPHI|nr:hypothetical protein [Mucilaginibacter segetis]MBK0379329.1 hypothetical protein [Mucilaginibacter segetis]